MGLVVALSTHIISCCCDLQKDILSISVAERLDFPPSYVASCAFSKLITKSLERLTMNCRLTQLAKFLYISNDLPHTFL